MKFRTRRVSAFFVTNFLAFTLLPNFTSAQIITSATIGTQASVGSIVEAPQSIVGAPVLIYIPSINLFSNVEGVGIDNLGRMDVPSGKTNNVGWYKYGILPGNTGTAVLDAHNTAAFKELDRVPVGSDIYIWSSDGKWLKFVIKQAQTYSVQSLSPQTLFAPANYPQINLITCAGINLGNGEATHRLIVSAELV